MINNLCRKFESEFSGKFIEQVEERIKYGINSIIILSRLANDRIPILVMNNNINIGSKLKHDNFKGTCVIF